jgi:hypothetical protein
MPDCLEDRVFSFVENECGTKRTKLSLDTRLSYDLGIEGDDAADFFDHFRKEFGVDIAELNQNWSSYFVAEGVSPLLQTIWCLTGAALSIGISTVFPRLSDWMAWGIGFAIWSVISFAWVRLRQRPSPNEIMVRNLVDWAKLGKATVNPFKLVVSDAQSLS